MESFYESWLKKFAEKAEKAKTIVKGSGPDRATTIVSDNVQLSDPSDIVYENDVFKLIVEKANFKRQKIFRLQDHLFKFKVVEKPAAITNSHALLSDLFDFLHAALTHALESIKTFYNKEDHNVAFLTLHQEPMVNGLNTGN